MGSKFQKNSILIGYTNSYCLVCECYFNTVEETSNHLHEKTHIEKLAAHPYLEKYGDNHIRKVNKGYFCEFCSLLLATATRVSLHVQEKSHYEKKGTFLLRRPSGISAVIAFEDIFIGERAWHSLADETCAICNEEFTDENVHKTDSGHLLKMVQSKVRFGAGNNVYRTTEDSSFQCLTCNSVFALNTLNEHFNNPEHKKLYAKCQEELKNYLEQNQSKDAKTCADAKKPADKNHKGVKNNEKDVKSVMEGVPTNEKDAKSVRQEVKTNEKDAKSVKEGVKTNEKDAKSGKQEVKTNEKDAKSVKEGGKTNEKDAKSVKEGVKTNENDAKSVKEGVKTNEKELEKEDETNDCKDIIPKTSKPVDIDATVFANDNKLTYNEGYTNAFCRICETKLPATLRSMKEHVNGKEHKNKMARAAQANQTTKAKPLITKRPLKSFIDELMTLRNMFSEDVVINTKYCLPLASFVMLTKNGARYRCQACEINVYDADIRDHANTSRHERAMNDTPVITSLPDSEFVREVRSNIYHCGFCNLIVPRWEEVSSHLQSREHKDNKDACAWRLRRHLPSIAEHRRREELHMLQILFSGNIFRR